MADKKGFTIIELLAVAGVFILVMAALTPFVKMAKGRANRVNCANNIMKMSLGLHSYAANHDGNFPQTLAELYPDYVDNEGVFDCPASKKAGSRADPDYEYTPGLKESSPGNTVILRDREGNHKRSGGNALKVNGSLEWQAKR